jgi:4-hydroxy-tetrahydrodipicolinate synthase
MTISNSDSTALKGVFPVLPTPFDDSGKPDPQSLARLVHYLIQSGVQGMTYPGVASEVGELTIEERVVLTQLVLETASGKRPVIVGGSAKNLEDIQRLLSSLGSSLQKASAIMVAAPAGLDTAGLIHFYSAVAQSAQGVPLMLQNLPAPAGPGLSADVVVEILKAVPAVQYMKEEALPSGQRLTQVLAKAPHSLKGVLGGAGGRYITDEIRRGACGTMPAIELAEVHVALWKAHQHNNEPLVNELFTRMLPVLNIQAIFRWSLTKYVLHSRGLIASTKQRALGPLIDPVDAQDVDAFLGNVRDLLIPDGQLQ